MFSQFLQLSPTSPQNLFFNPLFLPHYPPSFHKIPFKCHPFLLPTPKPLLRFHPLLATPPSNPAPLPNDQSWQTQEAQEAISEFLQGFGVSQADSDSISSNSPRYLKMLVDGVRDLDELSLWGSCGAEGKDFAVAGDAVVGFKKKVLYMAKEKGDNGKVAFLESVGLSLSAAMNVARYLSAESLPALVHKVKCMKELLFSGNNDGGHIGKNARRMMMYLSIPIDEELQQTLSFFEKIQARRGGLDTLGSNNASFRYLIESFPRLLLLSVESHMKPMVEFLENIGVPRGRLINLILLFPPIIFYNIELIKLRVLAFKEVAAVDKDMGKLLLKYPWILSTGIRENYKEVLYFFNLEKVPILSVHRAIKSWPHILGCSTSKLKLMVEHFDELGVRNKKLGQVIAKSPQLLLRKPQELLQVISFLEDLGIDKETIGRIICRCPEIFATSIEKTLKRKLEFLTNIGVSGAHVPRVIKKYPELFVSDVDRTLLPRMTYLMTLGLSAKDIAFMVRKFSPLLGYSIDEVLRPKVEFLVNTMEKPITDVVDYPRYFSYSLEKKIKPRFWVLKGKNVECSLKDMLGKNDDDFAAARVFNKPVSNSATWIRQYHQYQEDLGSCHSSFETLLEQLGMGVVTVSSSASRTPLGLGAKFSGQRSTLKRPLIVAFKVDKPNSTASGAPQAQIPLPIEIHKDHKKRLVKANKPLRRVKAVLTDEASPCTLEVDYNEAAAQLENIYKLSPTTDPSDVENVDGTRKSRGRRRKNIEGDSKAENRTSNSVIKNRIKKVQRLGLDKRIALKKNKENEVVPLLRKRKVIKNENVRIEKLVREYSASTDLVSLDWRKMKIPPVLPSSEHAWLFKLMQPMKALLEVKDNLQKDLGREPTEGELAEATNMNVVQVRKHMEVGRAARNKLIKHNLRLILFVIKKYFQEFANGPKFQDLCQAGVKGLITGIDRFEPKRKFRLSTYTLFWIRHAIIRSMTLSSFTRVSFGLESVRLEIQRAKLELLFELHRLPTKEEIIKKVGISPERYHEVLKASKPVLSLHSRHATTQEEYINGIPVVDGVGADNWKQPALQRLALDDVLDSLKPKESLVIRQRYGLDGKGDRTLGEIAGNLNISREMVRKHEVKAFMKLKHPARVDYLRQHISIN